jgi:hypothetical protein
MIVNIIDIEYIAISITKNDPVIWTYLDRPKAGIVACQKVNTASEGFNIVFRHQCIKGIQDQGNLRNILRWKLGTIPFFKKKRNPL